MGDTDGKIDPEDLERRIEAAYRASGNRLGWRLLSSPVGVLHDADVALTGMNPGGAVDRPDHARFAMDRGSAYEMESWHGHPPGQSPLQMQVRGLFRHLGVRAEAVLAGNLVRFRSTAWKDLKHPAKAMKFGTTIWKEILSSACPGLVISFGDAVASVLATILLAHSERRVPVGWGRVTASRWVFDQGNLIRLPHLSRFRVVGRAGSADALASLFGRHWHG